MRDYSFGNFISALRIRRGLSQYQLGALVGVSDKAVSKWENGVSKPRISTIVKLSEVLDIGTDELLACKYVAFNHVRKDLFAMDKEIIKRAEQKLTELYGEHPPISVINRFKTEELMLNGQKMLRWMGFLGKLYEQFYTEDAFFMVRGTQMGASFIAWLLGGTNVNPLPAHYYCHKCKRVEFIPNVKCGLDAPDKVCSCGNPYEKDGFAIDAIHMYPLTGGCEIYISHNAIESVKKCFREYFGEYNEIREIRIKEEIAGSYKLMRYIPLPAEMAGQYPDEIITIDSEGYYRTFSKFEKLVVVENTEERINFKCLANTKFTPVDIRNYAKYASEQGVFKDCLGQENLNEIVSNISNPNFSDLINIMGLLHGSGTWTGNGDILFANGVLLSEMITNREDTYAYLYSKLNGRCCDNPSGQVYEIKENIRKGKYAGGHMPDDTEKLLLDNGVPDWYVDSMKKIRYLFPKAQLIQLLKKDICNYINLCR